eukprot:1283488-Rhodomonas_salina.3
MALWHVPVLAQPSRTGSTIANTSTGVGTRVSAHACFHTRDFTPVHAPIRLRVAAYRILCEAIRRGIRVGAYLEGDRHVGSLLGQLCHLYHHRHVTRAQYRTSHSTLRKLRTGTSHSRRVG